MTFPGQLPSVNLNSKAQNYTKIREKQHQLGMEAVSIYGKSSDGSPSRRATLQLPKVAIRWV